MIALALLLSAVALCGGGFLIYILGAVFPGMRIFPDHWYGEEDD